MPVFKKIREKVKFYIAGVICRCVAHDLVITKKVSVDIQELRCLRCGGQYAICHSARAFLPLTAEIKAHNKIVSNGI